MSAATIRTITLPAGDASYDSDMPMGALRSLLSASTDGDLGGIMDAMTGIVLSWPYDGDPTDADAWDGLRRSEFNDVVSAVVEDLGELGEE